MSYEIRPEICTFELKREWNFANSFGLLANLLRGNRFNNFMFPKKVVDEYFYPSKASNTSTI